MNEPKSPLNLLIDELRDKQALPALNDTVLEMSRIVRKQDYFTSELSAVIMRDCGLASSLLSTVNSAFYSPRCPIKTVSAAVNYLGADKVFLLAMGLGMFRHIMATIQKRKLLKLYAISYCCGSLAMSFAKNINHPNPEEIFIIGLFYRLPCMILANSFPYKFHAMETRIWEQEMTFNQACLEIFEMNYDDFCKEVLALLNMPDDVVAMICRPSAASDPMRLLVEESDHLAAMLFGDQESGKSQLKESEKRISKIMGSEAFSVPDLLRHTFASDGNIKHFFNLEPDDVEMMINLLEWGKASPMEVVARMDFGSSIGSFEQTDSPEMLIGHFLTELALCRKRPFVFSQLLMLAQEALFRCLPDSEIYIAFSCDKTEVVRGIAYVGKSLQTDAKHFTVPMSRSDSVIVQCIKSMLSIYWHSGSLSLGLPYDSFGKEPFQHAYLCPIVIGNRCIGLCFVGRFKGEGFDERERVWIEQVTEHFASAFKTLKR